MKGDDPKRDTEGTRITPESISGSNRHCTFKYHSRLLKVLRKLGIR